MKKLLLFYALSFAVAIVGCRREEENPADNQKPEITIISPTSEDTLSVAQGASFNVEGNANDNNQVSLLNYAVELLQETSTTGEPWTVENMAVPDVTLGQPTASFSYPVSVPQNARPGVYQISFRAEDPAGNFGEAQTMVTVTTTNGDVDGDVDGDPTEVSITFTTPEANASFAAGNSITVSGNAMHPQGFENLLLRITHPDQESTGYGWLYDHNFTAAQGQTSYDFSHDVTIPNDVAPGTYYVVVTSQDANGTEITNTQTITITNGNEVGVVTFRLIEYPENTPEDATIYLTGDFGEDIPMQKDTDGTYFVEVERPVGTTIFYNYYYGTGTNEVDSEGNDIDHRNKTFYNEPGEVTDTVERWGENWSASSN